MAAEARSQREVLLAFSAMMLATLLAALDQTIVATALPQIVADLHKLDEAMTERRLARLASDSAGQQ